MTQTGGSQFVNVSVETRESNSVNGAVEPRFVNGTVQQTRNIHLLSYGFLVGGSQVLKGTLSPSEGSHFVNGSREEGSMLLSARSHE